AAAVDGGADSGSPDAADDAAPDAADDAGVSLGSFGPPPTMTPSCNGLDGIDVGTVLELVLDQGDRPNNTTCDPWTATAIARLPQVTVSGSCPNDANFTCARGSFVSNTAVGCRGSWSLSLGPDWARTRHDALVSVPDAGSTGNVWVLTRSIDVPQAQFCDGVFDAKGEVYCQDTFSVPHIAEVP